MKTDINSILKDGNKTTAITINYLSAKKLKELKELKEKSDLALSNKYVSVHKLNRFIINPKRPLSLNNNNQ